MCKAQASGAFLLALLISCCCLFQNTRSQCAELQKYVELSQVCDFYFDGYHHLPPILDLQSNGTFTPAISSSRDGVKVVRVGEVKRCKAYVATSLTFAGVGGDCHNQYRINDNNQVEAHFVQQQGALVDPFQASAIILFLDQLELEDGTCLTDGDHDTKYVESRRCVSFLTLPHFHAEVAAPAIVMREFLLFREKIMVEFITSMRKIQMNLKEMIQERFVEQLPSF